MILLAAIQSHLLLTAVVARIIAVRALGVFHSSRRRLRHFLCGTRELQCMHFLFRVGVILDGVADSGWLACGWRRHVVTAFPLSFFPFFQPCRRDCRWQIQESLRYLVCASPNILCCYHYIMCVCCSIRSVCTHGVNSPVTNRSSFRATRSLRHLKDLVVRPNVAPKDAHIEVVLSLRVFHPLFLGRFVV